MRYPKLCNWIIFKKNPDGTYKAKNCLSENEYTLGSTLAYLARHLDGKRDPYSILPDYSHRLVQEMLDELDRSDFLRYGRILECTRSSITYSLVIPKRNRTSSIIPIIMNYLLFVFWLPVFLLGIYCFLSVLPQLEGGSALLGQWIGILFGVVAHEAGHAFSALSYGARVFEAGILLQNLMPGAYVLIDDTPVRQRLRKVQISAAGVEMNILLSGMALIFSSYVPAQSSFFWGFAVSNIILALLNLTFSEGLDGLSMMSQLIGTDCWITRAKYTLTHKDEYRRLLFSGPHGIVELLICVLLLALQFGIPSLYLLYCLEVVECLI